MTEDCTNAEKFLSELVQDLGFRLTVSSEMTDEGCVLDLQGEDSHFAHAESGELLDALETILFQVFGRQIDRQHRFIVDADCYRKTRKKELQAMARFAGDQVRKSGNHFTFGILNSTERRIIHTALQAEDDLTSESVGEGRDRRLQVRLK